MEIRTRAARRAATRRVCRRRLALWRSFQLEGDAADAPEAGRYAKRHAAGCACRKRRKGRPRCDAGLCARGARERVYRGRAAVSRARAALRNGAFDADADVFADGDAFNAFWR